MLHYASFYRNDEPTKHVRYALFFLSAAVLSSALSIKTRPLLVSGTEKDTAYRVFCATGEDCQLGEEGTELVCVLSGSSIAASLLRYKRVKVKDLRHYAAFFFFYSWIILLMVACLEHAGCT